MSSQYYNNISNILDSNSYSASTTSSRSNSSKINNKNEEYITIDEAKLLINILEEIIQPSLKEDEINLIMSYNNLSTKNSSKSSIEEKMILGVNTIFYSRKIPKVGILGLFERILKYSKLDKATFINIFIYIDRVANSIRIMENNIYKIIIGAFICALKFCNDEIYTNSVYAKICGISLKEINNIEVSFLNLIDFKLNISMEEYKKYENHLIFN